MKTHITEGIDYNWIQKENAYGFTHTMPQLLNGEILRKIHEPSRNSIVLSKKENKLIPVLIIDGQYEVNGRLSNYWYWYEINEDLSLSEKKSGYGGFFKSHIDFKIKQEITISI